MSRASRPCPVSGKTLCLSCLVGSLGLDRARAFIRENRLAFPRERRRRIDQESAAEALEALKELFQAIQGEPAEIYRLDAEFHGAASRALKRARAAIARAEVHR